MKKPSVEQDHEVRMTEAREHYARRQLVAPSIFFAAVIAVILISVIAHRVASNNGGVDATTTALEVDNFSACIGLTVYENTDELDDSYGDYFYLGADFYETDVEYEREVGEYLGNVVYEGQDKVESFSWISEEGGATEAEEKALAEEIYTVYGDYTEQDGCYFWYADEKGKLGSNTRVAWVCCGIDEDGFLYVSGQAS